ncbi:TonB-dependent receptor domain-containing protein [Flavobacterium sp. MMS24-S5]|uniref:TonB-dependent receptor domain-containing protein n=1 Tax=Flavobacterium sp. MMS24-S5 TaxID=3416605 RepID=UPI003CFCBD6F
MTADSSFGNAFNPSLNVFQWTAFAPGNANYGKATPWVAAANDPGKFFQKSFSTVNNVGLSGGDEKGSYNFSYTNNNESGILPNSRLNRNILNGSFTRNLSDKIKTSAFFTFSDQSTVGRNSTGYGDNILTGFRQWWQTNVDVRELKDAYNVNGQNVTWNMNDPLNGNFAPAYWNNPYFDRYKNFSSDDRTRVLAGANISYDITKNFNVLGRVTVDTSNDRQELRKEKGSHAEEFGLQALDETSGYSLYTRSFLQTTYDFIATYDLKISEKISAKLLGGSTFIKSHVDSFDGSTTGGLVAPGLFTLANSMSFVAPIEQEINYNKLGLYTQGSIDYNRIVFVEGSYRRDQSTALPQNNNKYDYWSLGTSFIVSELIKQDWLNNLKLRANYAVVGNDPAAGLIGSKVNNGLIGGNLMFANSSTFVDFKNLRSEKLKSWEFGVEAAMFKNRLSFDVSVYQSNTTDQIFNVPQSTSTGFATSQINAGEMQNKGIEVSLFGSPVKTKDFEWQVGVNWSRNRNEVVSLNQGRDNLQLASWQNGVSLNATVGQPYGTMRGTDYVYDANGNKTVDEDGYYLLATDKVIGNIQADWIGGLSNRFNYKDFSLNFLIDMKKGGSVYSLDQAYGQYTGLYPETAGLNDLGNPLRNSIANGGGIILDGVYEDGTPNQSRIPANMVGAGFGVEVEPNKKFIYDASYVKLREVGFTYNVPSRFLDKTMAKSISFSLLGNNLWIIHKNLPYADPEAGQSSGNVQGFQSGVMPTTKVYSFNIKATF